MNIVKPSSLGVYTVIYVLVIYVPVLFIPLFSFNSSIYIAFPLQELTLQWYQEMASNSSMIGALQNSVKVALAVCVLSTVLGTLAAKTFTRYRLPAGVVLKGFIAIPLVIPLIILGISLMVMFNRAGVDLSLITIGIGHIVICTPFSMMVMISRLEGFDKEMEEAAQDLGETPWMTFWRVTFPLSVPGIVASLLLTFTISFDEFLLAFFLSGDKTTLPVYIWSQLRFPDKLPGVLALGTCILAMSAVVVGTAEFVRRRGAQPAGRSQAR